MVLDTSALVAMHLKETGYETLFQRVQATDVLLIGAPTLFETAMVLTSREGVQSRLVLAASLRRMGVSVVSFTEDHFHQALDAFIRFGKGRHPAALNFGDCMSYAVARVAGMPLLYTGKDFSKTDITPA